MFDHLRVLHDDGSVTLRGGRCGACSRHHFPVAAVCPWCSSEDVGEVALSDHGTVWGWASVEASPPGYGGEVPFGFGVVELPEGIRIVTRLNGVGSLDFGTPVRLEPAVVGEDDDGRPLVSYAFSP